MHTLIGILILFFPYFVLIFHGLTFIFHHEGYKNSNQKVNFLELSAVRAWVVYACLKCDQILKCFVALVKINRYNWMKNLTRDNMNEEPAEPAEALEG